jgi:hypothetical protein
MIIFDRGKQLGQSPEELGKSIEPLTGVLDRLIADAAENDFAGVCEAVKELQSEVRMHEQDKQRIEEKAKTALTHVQKLMEAIKTSMKTKGVAQRMDRGYSATLVEIDGRVELSIR